MFAQLIEEVRFAMEAISREQRGKGQKAAAEKVPYDWQQGISPSRLNRAREKGGAAGAERARTRVRLAMKPAAKPVTPKRKPMGARAEYQRYVADVMAKERRLASEETLAEKSKRSERWWGVRGMRRARELEKRYRGLEKMAGMKMTQAAPAQVHKATARQQARYAASQTGSSGQNVKDLRSRR